MPSALRARPGRRRELALAVYDSGHHQHEIAAIAGISPMTLSGIVTGRIATPRQATRTAIAKALDRDVAELFPDLADDDTDVYEHDEALAAQVRAERVAQGVSPELTDEQLRFIGAVVASDARKPRDES